MESNNLPRWRNGLVTIPDTTLPEKRDREGALAGTGPAHDTDLLAALDVAVDVSVYGSPVAQNSHHKLSGH